VQIDTRALLSSRAGNAPVPLGGIAGMLPRYQARATMASMRKLAGIIAYVCGLGLLGVLLVCFVAMHNTPLQLAGVQADSLPDIHQQAINDSITQYGMTQRSGTPIDVCLRAGLVAEAYLQANQETGYKQWKITQHRDCLRAGVPGR
jgi:hypothetical protein